MAMSPYYLVHCMHCASGAIIEFVITVWPGTTYPTVRFNTAVISLSLAKRSKLIYLVRNPIDGPISLIEDREALGRCNG